jgi:hypothetical protein
VLVSQNATKAQSTSVANWAGLRPGGYDDDKKKKKKFTSLYDFDWTVVGQFEENKVKLLNRNTGLLLKSLEISKERMDVCKIGTEQIGLFGDKEMNIKKFVRKDAQEFKNDNTFQQSIDNAW